MVLKRIPVFEFVIVLVLILSHIAAAVSPVEKMLRWYTTDDAFYYFKVATNISDGYGITFDRFGPTNGFHPLWMLVCVPVFTLARVNLFLPLRVLIIILGILQAATGVLLFRMTKRYFALPISMLVAILWIFSPLVHSITAQNGLEAGISAFFLVLSMSMLARINAQDQPASTKQLVMIGLVGALAFLSRLDNIFVITMLGVWLVFRSSPIRYYLSLDIIAMTASVLLSYMIWVGLGLVFYQYGYSALAMIAVGIISKVTAGYLGGVYQPPLSVPIISRIKGILIGVSIGSAFTGIAMFVLMEIGLINGFPRMAILIDWGITIVLLLGIRLLIEWLAQGSVKKSSPTSPLENIKTNGRSWLKAGSIYFGILGSVIFAYFVWNQLQFGTMTPVSGQIKEWWGTIYTIYGRPAETPTTYWGIDTRFLSARPTDTDVATVQSRKGPWVMGISWLMFPAKFIPNSFIPILWIVYGGFGLALLKAKRSAATKITEQLNLVPLLAGCFLQVWVINARGYVAIREWYWVAELIFTCLVAGVILNSIISLIPRSKQQIWTAYSISIILCMLVLGGYVGMIEQRLSPLTTEQISDSYLTVVRALEASTEPNSVIGMTGGGDMAYFIHGRTIVNLDGLISSNTYFEALKKSEAAEYLASIGLNYVYGKADILTQTDPYQNIFTGRLKKVTRLDKLVLYRFTYETDPK
jgi:hypothetical protein